MKLSELENLIDRYLAGKASAEEKRRVEHWLDAPTNDTSGLTPEKRKELARYFWHNILANISVAGTARSRSRRGIVALFSHTKIRVAASLFFLVMAAVIIKYIAGRDKAGTPVYAAITAKEGSTVNYLLPDGSKACLFPGSVIQVPDNYNQSDRKVKVTGRVFFDVQHDKDRAFYVQAGELQTRVLGTSFEVNTLSSQHPTVTVKSGKVAVSYKGRQLTELTFNKRLSVDVSQAGAVSKVDSVNAASICSWWNGAFYFEQTSLPEVLQNISQWYKIPVIIQGAKWHAEKVTMQVETKLSIQEVMHLLSETLGNNYKITPEHIIIY